MSAAMAAAALSSARMIRRAAPSLSAADINLAYAAAQKVVETHRRLVPRLRAGLTLLQVDKFVGDILAELGCKSCFLGYKIGRNPPFPSYACLSVNECVVHGTGTYLKRPLRTGDLLKVDIGVAFRGFIGDAAWTYSLGEPSKTARSLMESGKESLRRGVEQIRPSNTWLAWAQAVQGHVERECGHHLVRGLGGHGYGRKLHEPPFVSNVVPSSPGEWPESTLACAPGTLVAVEPMIAAGTSQTVGNPDPDATPADAYWPILTADGSLSVHYEHDVLVTPDGNRVLTEGMESLPDVVGVG